MPLKDGKDKKIKRCKYSVGCFFFCMNLTVETKILNTQPLLTRSALIQHPDFTKPVINR